ncbi:MAG: hypothetical protein NXI20_00545 [bacterium]|nr:hypothetical protein [bacterium]
MKFLLTLLLFGFLSIQHEPTLKPNSIGVAYLEESNEDFYQLKVVFPSPRLQNTPEDLYNSLRNGNTSEFNFNGTLQFFDDEGMITELQQELMFRLDLWCENDGGIQIRPTGFIKIRKDQLIRTFPKAISEAQSIVCFVGANIDDDFQSVAPISQWTDKIIIESDLNNDGNVDARLWTMPDDAENCDQNPPNNLMIYLDANGRNNPMRCCGP